MEIENIALEKRGHLRIGIETQVSIRSVRNHSMMLCWIQDISRGGFKVKVDVPLNFKEVFHEGDEVIFETYEDFFRLKGKGEIRWTSIEEKKAGVRFDDLERESKTSLSEFLEIFS